MIGEDAPSAVDSTFRPTHLVGGRSLLAGQASLAHNTDRIPTGAALSTEPRDPVETATILTRLALAAKAQDPSMLDMRGLVDYCDVFVVLTCRNRRHVAAIAEELRLYAKRELGMAPVGIEGLPAARWVLVDFGSVIIHLFDQPLRGFYNLDGLWIDAPRIDPPTSDGGEFGDAQDAIVG